MARKRANGEGSVYQRESDGRWAASISLANGKRKHFLGHSSAEVSAKRAEALANLQKGIQPPKGNQSVAQYLDFWIRSVKSSVRPTTYQSYELNVNRLRPLIGKLRLTNLTPAVIEQAYAALQERGLSARSVKQVHTVLHGALKKAVIWELLGRNPSEAVSVPRPERHEMKTLSEAQVQKLFASTSDDRMHALWVLLTTTSLRLGEACGLQWQDVDLERGSLTVRRALQRQKGVGFVFVEPKTRLSRRKVHLPPGTVAVLAAHRKRQLQERLMAGAYWQDQDLIFCRQNGSPLEATNLLPEFHRALAKAELPKIRLHDLRHTAATLLLQMGEHPKVVQEMLGHSTITLTLDTYSHVVPSMQAEAARKMQTLFG
ncbi:MAG: tyrosine-type recombinase/integrase [Dehalococcoidia bacterium]|nr:tyrosine-type recombinase/integrase [Dehalococcoidia bacterium]